MIIQAVVTLILNVLLIQTGKNEKYQFDPDPTRASTLLEE